MADVVIRIGNAHTNLSDEYILEVQHAAHDLADQSGFFVELHIVQRVPKRRGMTPIQWFGMTVLSGAGLKMGSDLYDYGKTLCKNLWEAGGRHRHQGVRLLDEHGELLKDEDGNPLQWSTQELSKEQDDHN